jgi:hypothetical protein
VGKFFSPSPIQLVHHIHRNSGTLHFTLTRVEGNPSNGGSPPPGLTGREGS